jgi:hypothetical protein
MSLLTEAERGMVGKRDNAAPRYDLIPAFVWDRIAETYREGAEHYGEGNYRYFTEEQRRDSLNHAVAHILSYWDGERSEDHLAHAVVDILMFMEMQREEDIVICEDPNPSFSPHSS